MSVELITLDYCKKVIEWSNTQSSAKLINMNYHLRIINIAAHEMSMRHCMKQISNAQYYIEDLEKKQVDEYSNEQLLKKLINNITEHIDLSFSQIPICGYNKDVYTANIQEILNIKKSMSDSIQEQFKDIQKDPTSIPDMRSIILRIYETEWKKYVIALKSLRNYFFNCIIQRLSKINKVSETVVFEGIEKWSELFLGAEAPDSEEIEKWF